MLTIARLLSQAPLWALIAGTHQDCPMPFRNFAAMLSALASLLLLPPEPLRAATVPASGAHSCLPGDFEYLRARTHRIVSPASKHAVGVSVGDPLTVRLIYFLPNDREAQDDIDETLDSMIRDVQASYAEQMENHGFGSRTFRLETDADGNTVVHHMTGKFADAHYQEQPWVGEEVSEQFDLSRNIYFVALDVSSKVLGGACGLGGSNGPEGGMALLPAPGSGCFNTSVAAHELGHAFGLAHDHFRNTTRSPSSYHTDWMVTSFHAAQWLDAHRYFNIGRSYPLIDGQTTIAMLSPLSVPPLSVRLRFDLSDPDGLHQAQLHNAGGEAIDSQGLKRQVATVEFVTTEVTAAPGDRVLLRVVDVYGNVTEQAHSVDIATLLPKVPVSIPSASLASLVRERLGLDPDDTVTQIDMLRLRGLEASGLEIADLAGLESAVNLKALHLPDNQIEDLSPIAGSTILESLDLNRNSVSDISSLADMGNLTVLILSGNAVTDLSPLADLAVLEILNLDGNTVSDLSPLEGMPSLADLNLVGASVTDSSLFQQLPHLVKLAFGGDSVTDLSPVEGLTRLSELRIVESPVSDLSPLARLDALTHLHVVGGAVDDLSPLAGLTRLEELNVSENSISDLATLAGMTHLRHLYLARNRATDVSPLAGLFNLTELDLSDNSVSDLSPLAGLTQLAHLRLGGNTVSDLSPLAGLVNLRELDLWQNSVSDLSPLAGMAQLRYLHLALNSVTDVSPLAGLVNLRELDLSESTVSDLSPLAGLTQLAHLRLGGNTVSDLSALAGLFNLRELDLWANSVSDLSPLAGMTHLRRLYLARNRATDVSPLAGLFNLTELDLSDNSVSDLSPLTSLTGLRELDLSGNPLSDRSIDIHIPALRSRGVTVRGTFAGSDIPSVDGGPAPHPPPIPDLEEFTNDLRMQFVKIPAGEFSMGATGAWARYGETPVTRVRISEAFWMGKHEVTQGQWQTVMGSNPSTFQHCGADCPVESVSWYDVQGFIARLNERDGEERYRLPTEAEWEYAARAGTETDTYAGDLSVHGSYDAPLLDGIAWYGGNSGVDYEGGEDCTSWAGRRQYASSRCGTHPVGGKAPNRFALLDVLGNVQEWVEDWEGSYPGGTVNDPAGPKSGSYRVRRGGGWNDWATTIRSASRTAGEPDWRFSSLGFRLVRVDSADEAPGGPDAAAAEYSPLDDWTVSDGRVQFFFTSAGGCISIGNTTLNGVTYTVHSSKWQRRDDASSAWTDIPGTQRTGRLCPHSPSGPGQYRGVAEISIDGERGKYSTKNVLTVEEAFHPQRVEVALGESGEIVTLMTAEDGSFRLGGAQFNSGDTVTDSNGNKYRLTLGADGAWTATLVADAQPTFGTATVSNQTYTAGTAIAPLTLPTASGGDGTLSYSLAPGVPGLTFGASTSRLTGTPTTPGTYNMTYTARDADGDTVSLSFVLTVSRTSSGTEDADGYAPLDDWTVSDGRVQFFFFSAGQCVSLSNTTLNGVTYTIHTSRWQRRVDADSAWTDIPGTERTGRVCSYSPTESGQYRSVAEISVDGERGNYSSKNVLTVAP